VRVRDAPAAIPMTEPGGPDLETARSVVVITTGVSHFPDNPQGGQKSGFAEVRLYNRHQYMQEKREALGAWAKKVDLIVNSVAKSSPLIRFNQAERLTPSITSISAVAFSRRFPWGRQFHIMQILQWFIWTKRTVCVPAPWTIS
jgi:hypothetical protein